jgi:hypothetical protein
MELTMLLKGLKRDSKVTAEALKELLVGYKKLVLRSVSNDNWTEQDQEDFELARSILRENGVNLDFRASSAA